MELELLRYYDDGDNTYGLLKLDDEFFCYTLEDEFRVTKVKHETRIPAGTYRIDYLKQETPLTKKYQKRFPWFQWHLHLKNVPGFTGIYIHIGNKDDDTSGCILVGNSVNPSAEMIYNSTITFRDLYREMSAALDDGEDIFITISDI